MRIKNLLEHKPLLILSVGLTALLTWGSLAKFINPISIKIEGSDKYAHFIAYFTITIAWTLFLFFSEKLNKSLWQSLSIAAVLCFLYGLLMELLQALLTTYRSSDWYDVIANTSGTVFAMFVFVMFKNKLIKIKQNNQEIK